MSSGAIAAAINGYNSGVDRRRKLQLQAKQDEQQLHLYDQTSQENDLKIKALQQKVDAVQSAKIKQDIYSAWDGQSLVKLNYTLDNNKKTRDAFGVSNIKFFPPPDEALPSQIAEMKRKGIKPENAYIGTQTLPDGTTKEIVFDMNKKKMAAGYLTYVAQRKLAMADAQIKEQKAMQSLLPTLDNVKAQSFEAWSKKNPNGTFAQWSKGKTEGALEKGYDFILKTNGKPAADAWLSNQQNKQPRRDKLKQETEAQDRLKKAQEIYNNNPTAENLKNITDASTIYDSITAGPSQVRENTDVNGTMVAKKAGLHPEKYTKQQRDSIQAQFVNTKNADIYKKPHLEFMKSMVTVRNVDRLRQQLNEAVNSGEYKSDIVTNLKLLVRKYTPNGKLSKADVGKIILEAKLDKNTANVLREISGTAASDTERAYTMSYTIGQIGYNEKSRQVIFNASYDKMRKDTIEQGKLLVHSGFVGDVYDQLKSLEPSSDKKVETPNSLVGQIVQGPDGSNVKILEVDNKGNPTKYVKVQ